MAGIFESVLQHMLNEPTTRFLWKILSLGFGGGDTKRVCESIACMYEQDIDLSVHVEALLAEYLSSGDRGDLLAVALFALKGFWFGIEPRTRLAAVLFATAQIDVSQAYAYLAFEGSTGEELPPSIRRLADIFWLLKQDADAHVMQPNHDNLLEEQLRVVASEGLAPFA